MGRKEIFFAIKRYSKAVRDIVPANIRMSIKEKLLEKDIEAFGERKEKYDPDFFARGVNLIGSIRAENGLGQSCRLVANQLKESHVNFSVFNIDFNANLRESDQTYEHYISDTLPYAINVFHINPCELGNVVMRIPDVWNKHYNIAFWLWELEEFPDEWIKYCLLFDEIWTPSEFAGRGVKKKTSIMVKTMPYTVSVSADENCTRESFGLPDDKFLYLVMYDANSTNERKNPEGAIEAYKKAFPKEKEDHGLVIKINNVQKDSLHELQQSLSKYRNVYFITDVLEKNKVNSLISCVDVLVSLHRAEGFGLVLAEAMLLGTPVIATNWSSNTEFMDLESSCMVKYHLVASKKREGLYKRGCIWAEPDTEDAAAYMSRLKNDPVFYEEMKKKGRQCLEERLNEEQLADLWSRTIKEIENGR